jgi:bifunctional UDP-N-acetylglucosamine pyrophosphorylase/glucosamine-1-phosphate N-acetyltransferase
MQAVIMAAGKSTRTYPLTVNTPKPLLKVLDKTIMEHNLDQLTGVVDEAIIVVGFKKEMFMEKFGSNYKGIKITYAEQKEQLGTGHALMSAKQFLKDRFLVMGADDIFSKKDILAISKHEYAVLVKEVEDVRRFGAVVVEEERVTKIVEKPATQVSKYANTGLFSLKKEIFEIKLKKSKRGEYELVDYITELAKKGKVKYEIVTGHWLSVGYPWDYLEVNVNFLHLIKEKRIDKSAVIEKGVVIKGIVSVGKNTIIKSGTYIEGPVFIGDNCEIGPSAYLRKDTIIMNNVRTRAETVDSVLMDGVTAKHNCYIGHSVIGERANIAAGTVTADYRHDGKSNKTLVKDVAIDTGRKKLGAFIGDDVRLGIGTLIYPGRKIWPGGTTLPGEIVKKDIIK